MRLISENYNCSIHETVRALNREQIARFVFQIELVNSGLGGSTIVVFKLDSYEDYLWFCKQTSRKPLNAKAFLTSGDSYNTGCAIRS